MYKDLSVEDKKIVQYFSDTFDTIMNSFRATPPFGTSGNNIDLSFNEYEKSVFLTLSQKELVTNLYNGKNPFGESFENTEELRRYLDSLIKTTVYTESETNSGVLINTARGSKTFFYSLPKDLAFITLEQVKYDDDNLGCDNGCIANVYPITQDEFSKVIENPFRGPTKYKAIRLDNGLTDADRTVEIISKYNIAEYLVRYMASPTPIVLVDLPGKLNIEGLSESSPCKLNSILFDTIIKGAVQLAYASRVGYSNNNSSATNG